MHEKILHIILAVCLLVGQSGIPVWTHFCEGESRGQSLFDQQESCHELSTGKSCCASDHSTHEQEQQDEEKDDCCSDELSFFRLAQVEPPFAELATASDCYSSLPPAEVHIKKVIRPLVEKQLFADWLREKPPPKPGRIVRIFMASFLC